MTIERNFLDFLSDTHKLPSFNLPTDAVPFIARTLKSRTQNEEISVNMSTGLEQALTQYAPGKELVVRKKSYVSGGLYLDYPPRPTPEELEDLGAGERYNRRISSVVNRFLLWFEQAEEDEHRRFLSWHHRCNQPSCQHTLQEDRPRSEVPAASQTCQMCDIGQFVSIPMLRPPGFAPLVWPDGRVVETDADNYDFRLSTKWPTQIIGDNDTEDSLELGDRMNIRFMKARSLVNINAGKGQIEEEDGFGFSFCRKCGNLSHDAENVLGPHNRPYAIPATDRNYCGIPTSDLSQEARSANDNFRDARQSQCNNSDTPEHCIIYDGETPYRRLILGRKFTTDLIVFRIPWDTINFITMDPGEDAENISRIGALTVLRAFLESITGDDSLGLNIENSDVDGDVRRYRDGDEEGWELFIFERSDGGIGLLQALYNHLEVNQNDFDLDDPYDFPVIGRALSRLEGRHCSTLIPIQNGDYVSVHQRPCKHICKGCLLDYSTQYLEADLERTTGHHLLLYALYGSDFEDRIGITMTDDQKSLHSLLQSIDGMEDADLIESDRSLGHYGEEHDDPPDSNDLLGAIGVRHGDNIYTIHSPLFSRDDDSFSFSRNNLHNDPLSIIQAFDGDDDEIPL